MDTQKWYTSKIIQGNKLGRTIGYPTLNLNNPELLSDQQEGVYAVLVKINEKEFQGALYYGPRKVLKETKNVIEIFLFHFEGFLYDQTISFSLQKHIRGVMDFSDLTRMKEQLAIDCAGVQNFFKNAFQ